tara:strand:- start:393 stop:1319 length:927 start_codon:yes stop_codon:yes gene_type:complete
MNILLLGATGLLGSALIKTNPGYQIRAVSRKMNPRSYINSILQNKEINFIKADIQKLPLEVFKNIDVIINSAGLSSSKEKDFIQMKQVNEDSVKDLVAKALLSGVKHFIQVSSSRTLQGVKEDTNFTISENYQGIPTKDSYAQSKFAADQIIKNSKIKFSIVYPGYMFGEYDARPSSGSILLALKHGIMSGYINRYKNFVYSEDVAEGIWYIIKNKISDNFILGNQNVLIKDFLEVACKKLNCSIPKECNDENFQTLVKEKSFIEEFCNSYALSSDKALKSFGYQPKENLEGMIDKTISYFQECGLLK